MRTMRDSGRPSGATATPTEELLSLIFDSIHEGVFTVDQDFRITSFNHEAERITGVPRREAVGKKCYEVFRASICQQGCALKQTLATGKPLRDVRIDVLNAAMLPVPLTVSTAVLRRGGRLMGGVEIFRDISDIESLRNELKGQGAFENIVGTSPPMRELFRLLPDVAASDAPVLIEGPSGTGKELVATAIHSLSARRDKPFVRVNCGALPDTLLESELFGYRRGAFTDARRDKPGHFTLADGGTILLDEIGDVTPAFQLKLLRVLQEGEIERLGGESTRKVNVRLVAATNVNLEAAVERGQFRRDLFYRLNVYPICIPPLRERTSDIEPLARHLLARFTALHHKRLDGFSDRALQSLARHGWPGNVRELENLVERGVILAAQGGTIEAEHLFPNQPDVAHDGIDPQGRLARRAPQDEQQLCERVLDSGVPIETLEAQVLALAVERSRGNLAGAARMLGISRAQLAYRLKRQQDPQPD